MGKPLRVLIVEDRELDAQLLIRELTRGGFEVASRRVDTRDAMNAALGSAVWDIVVADYSLPTFSASAALACLQESKLDLPFIVVSGTVNEQIAVDVMRAGAHDFMAKDNFARLIPAVERELRDAALRLERARMQEQLLISDRMASVGTLAAGVAHEINNPLAAMMANLQLATAELARLGGDLAAVADPLRDASESAERVRQIVRDLRVFSRHDETATGPVDLHRVLDSSVRIASAEIRHRACLVREYGAKAMVEGNEGRLGQVFLNLIVNAAQAIPEGRVENHEIRLVTRADPRGHVVAEVRDTGSGIPEDVVGRIFDPFFTTKPIGVGTGLGLAICHRIITTLGGEIRVSSQVGAGTVVTVTLPPASGEIRAQAPSLSAVAGPRGRVLVVDDEAVLGRALRRILATDHDVSVDTSGRDALARISAGERYDVILCDLMMPNLTGMDLYDELRQLCAEQAERMVFMSGGAFTVRAREFLDAVHNPRVDKPLDLPALRAIVHRMVAHAQN